MAKVKLVSNVAEFGLFRSVARTRVTLILATLAALGAAVGAAFWSSDYIMNRSSSVGLNILIITANMMLVMVAGYLQAVLAGDLFFKGPWREQVILGERPWKEDSEALVVTANHNAEFMIVLVVAIIANALLVNALADDFVNRYHEEGFFRARLRSSEPGERLQAMRDMADPTQYELWENPDVRALVAQSLSDTDPQVRSQAAWNSGVMKVLLSRDALLALLEDATQPDDVRSEAAIALARLGADEKTRLLVQEVMRTSASPALTIGMLKALGSMEQRDTFESILEVARGASDEEVMIYALWAMQRTQNKQARVWLLEELEKKPEGRRLCALLDAMKMVSTPADVTWARKAFLSAPREVKCERVVWEERDERLRTILFSDTLRTKYVKIVANSGEAAKWRTWFQRIVNDTSEPWPLREATSDIILQLNNAGL